MAKYLKISIITVSYNAAKTIEQTILSVVNQTYKNIEYIIIDGGSTDGTVDIIKKYTDKLAYWVSEPDDGIYDAMNKGIKAMTGDYVQFLGADDFLADEDTIGYIVRQLDQRSDILSAGIFLVREEFGLEKYLGNHCARDKNKYNGVMIPHPGMFVKKELMQRYGFDTQYRIAADYDFFLQCYLNKDINFKFIDRPVVYFSLAGISATDINAANELFAIMGKYDFGNKQIRRMKIKAFLYGKVKEVFAGLHILKNVLQNFQGWHKHHCNNSWCRWCHGVTR